MLYILVCMSIINERAVETIIDDILANKGWVDHPRNSNRNVYKQAAKTIEQKQSLGGKFPDYVLYRTNSDKPLIVIEAKKPGKNITQAMNQCEGYANSLDAPICYVTDGVYTKTKHIAKQLPLFKNGEEVDEFIRENEALQYLHIGSNEINTLDKRVITSRQELINILDSSNSLLRSEGLSLGLDRFSEFSNILFLKLISELESAQTKPNLHTPLAKEYLWDYFKNKTGTDLLNYVNDTVLREFQEKYKEHNIFTKLKIKRPSTLEKIIEKLDELSLTDINSDIKGDAFEYFLSKYTAKHNTDLGEYFTPRHIVKACVKLVNPQIGEKIYDPFCGTGGMLIESFKHIAHSMSSTDENWDKLRKSTVYGNEITDNARITKMNMILMGDGHNNIRRLDSLREPVDAEYHCVITNMPFNLPDVEDAVGSLYDLSSKNGNAVCLQHSIRALREGGRMAIIVPDSLLTADLYTEMRKYILRACEIKSIVSLPHGVFAPYSKTVKTNIVYLHKRKASQQKYFWHFTVRDRGHSITSSKVGLSMGRRDLETFLVHRNDYEHSLFHKISIENIVEDGYILAPDRNVCANTQYDIALGDICIEIKEKAGDNYSDFKPMTISNRAGFMDKSDYYKKQSQQTQTKSPEKHKKVHPGHFAYRTIEGLTIGTIGLNRSKDVYLVSPIYTVFKVDEAKVNPEYLYRLLISDSFKELAKGMLKGTARPSISFKDFRRIQVPIPSLDIQQKIADYISEQLALLKNVQKIDSEIGNNIDKLWQSRS